MVRRRGTSPAASTRRRFPRVFEVRAYERIRGILGRSSTAFEAQFLPHAVDCVVAAAPDELSNPLEVLLRIHGTRRRVEHVAQGPKTQAVVSGGFDKIWLRDGLDDAVHFEELSMRLRNGLLSRPWVDTHLLCWHAGQRSEIPGRR